MIFIQNQFPTGARPARWRLPGTPRREKITRSGEVHSVQGGQGWWWALLQSFKGQWRPRWMCHPQCPVLVYTLRTSVKNSHKNIRGVHFASVTICRSPALLRLCAPSRHGRSRAGQPRAVPARPRPSPAAAAAAGPTHVTWSLVPKHRLPRHVEDAELYRGVLPRDVDLANIKLRRGRLHARRLV